MIKITKSNHHLSADKQAIPASNTSSPKSSKRGSSIFRTKGFLQGRAAQMLGLVTKQSLAEKLASDIVSRADGSVPAANASVSTDELTIVALPNPKKDPANKAATSSSGSAVGLVSSPSGHTRQDKMFSNMNCIRLDPGGGCSSPSSSLTSFKDLRNDGERISPKLQKHDVDNNSEDVGGGGGSSGGSGQEGQRLEQNGQGTAGGDESPRSRRELPILEWSNANPPSLTASPSASILKRMQEFDAEMPSRVSSSLTVSGAFWGFFF